jgi:lipopolysaccharide export LptBFGC system permease protein LptF
VIGVLLGVLFFLITRTVENGGQLFNLNPMLVGWLPTMGVTLCTVVAISRTR